MPILLSEDAAFPLPKMHRVRQTFRRERLKNVEKALTEQIGREEIRGKLFPGAKVAVAVGSRGIRNLSMIVATTIREIRRYSGEPFIISAMGSHGAGTPEGQREVLSAYGITEEALGVPVVTEMDTTHLGETAQGVNVYFDSAALAADLIVPINRIKLHTDFVADIQSGLCKMLVIGLGNHRGCTAIHENGFETFGETILAAAELILKKAPVGFGIGIVENAYDETALVEAIPAERLIPREKELCRMARENMPTLMIPEIDVLVVEEIGKDISGAGYDPNILGRSYILKEFVLPGPRVNQMVLLGISPGSHGNAIGMGAFDVITRRVYEGLDLTPIYANAVAIGCLHDAKIPLVAADEDEAVRIAVKVAQGVDRKRLRIVRIKNTLELEHIQVSDALLETVAANPALAIE